LMNCLFRKKIKNMKFLKSKFSFRVNYYAEIGRGGETHKIAKINGELVQYDMCSTHVIDITNETLHLTEREGFEFLGEGIIHSINGNVERGDKLYLFWKRAVSGERF